MITEAELLEAHYNAHPWRSEVSHPYAARLFQKWIRRDPRTFAKGKLFAINFFEYLARPEIPLPLSYAPEARFYLLSSDGGGFDVALHDRVSSVLEAEAFFMGCYIRLGCVPDPHNQG